MACSLELLDQLPAGSAAELVAQLNQDSLRLKKGPDP